MTRLELTQQIAHHKAIIQIHSDLLEQAEKALAMLDAEATEQEIAIAESAGLAVAPQAEVVKAKEEIAIREAEAKRVKQEVAEAQAIAEAEAKGK